MRYTRQVSRGPSGGRLGGDRCNHQGTDQDNHKQTHIYNMYSGHRCICTMKEITKL